MITFTVPGNPVGKGRPRVVRAGKFTRTYTPQPTIDFENRVRFAAEQAGAVPLEGPVELEIVCWFAMPKSRHLKRNPRPAEWKTTTPDLDNVVKAIADSLNGLCYADDSQVVEIAARKLTAAQGEPARTVVMVRQLEGAVTETSPLHETAHHKKGGPA